MEKNMEEMQKQLRNKSQSNTGALLASTQARTDYNYGGSIVGLGTLLDSGRELKDDYNKTRKQKQLDYSISQQLQI